MRRLIASFVVLLCLASVAVAAPKTKKKAVPVEDEPAVSFDVESCVDKAIDLQKLMITNPYDTIGKCYWLSFPMVKQQLLSRSVALIGFASAQQNVFALMDFGEDSVPVMGPISGLVMGLGAYQYETVSGSVNTVHHLKKMKGYLKRTESQQREKDARDKIENERKQKLEEEQRIADQKAADFALEEKKAAEVRAQKIREEKERAAELEKATLAEQVEKTRIQAERDYMLVRENEKLLDRKIQEAGLEIKDDVIIDKNTGLMWTRDANIMGRTNLEIMANWLDTFTYGDYKWRIPTTRELKTLSKYGPEILSRAAINVQDGCYLTTSKTLRLSSLCVNIKEDTTRSYDIKAYQELYAWPVRGGGVTGWFKNVME